MASDASKTIFIRTITAADGQLLRSVTIRSVTDSPDSFGGESTLAEEESRDDAEWDQLAKELDGQIAEWRDRCVGYFAMDGDNICGKVLCNLLESPPATAVVTAMWVDPAYRRRGIGSRLLEAAQQWAVGKRAKHLRLWVDEFNPAGEAFYRSLGFVSTARSRPVSPGSSRRERGFELVL